MLSRAIKAGETRGEEGGGRGKWSESERRKERREESKVLGKVSVMVWWWGEEDKEGKRESKGCYCVTGFKGSEEETSAGYSQV